MQPVYYIWIGLFALYLLGTLVEYLAHKRSARIQDKYEREHLGKEYYEQLWGYGSWEDRKL